MIHFHCHRPWESAGEQRSGPQGFTLHNMLVRPLPGCRYLEGFLLRLPSKFSNGVVVSKGGANVEGGGDVHLDWEAFGWGAQTP